MSTSIFDLGLFLEDFGVVFFTEARFGHALAFQFFEDIGEGGTTEMSIHRRLIELQTASKHQLAVRVPATTVLPHLTDKSRFEPVLAHLKTRGFHLIYCLIC